MSILHWIALIMMCLVIAALSDLLTVRRVPGGFLGFFLMAFLGGLLVYRLLGFFIPGKIFKLLLEGVGGVLFVQLYRWIRWEI